MNSLFSLRALTCINPYLIFWWWTGSFSQRVESVQRFRDLRGCSISEIRHMQYCCSIIYKENGVTAEQNYELDFHTGLCVQALSGFFKNLIILKGHIEILKSAGLMLILRDLVSQLMRQLENIRHQSLKCLSFSLEVIQLLGQAAPADQQWVKHLDENLTAASHPDNLTLGP